MKKPIRFEGTLIHWDEREGRGLIKPLQGGQALPVQAAELSRDGRRPRAGETWSFEMRIDPQGLKRAADARRVHTPGPDSQAAEPTEDDDAQPTLSRRAATMRNLAWLAAAIGIVLAVWWLAGMEERGRQIRALTPEAVAGEVEVQKQKDAEVER